MKRLIGIMLAALVVAGCASYDNKGTRALDILAGAILAGDATYEQLQAIEAQAAEAKESVEKPVEDAECPEVSGKPPAATATAPQPAIVPESGKAVAVILGSTSCSWTRKLLALDPVAGIEAALPGVDAFYADSKADAATYRKYRPRAGFSFPWVRVFDEAGAFRGEFVARGVTVAELAEKVGALAGGGGAGR